MRYRYYVSQPGLHGEARTAKLGSVSRVRAPEIEQAIVSAIQAQLTEQKTGTDRGAPVKFEGEVIGSWTEGAVLAATAFLIGGGLLLLAVEDVHVYGERKALASYPRSRS